jgi:Xaa-Pro aminopeptidase
MGWEPEGLTRWPAPHAAPQDVGTTRLDWNICYQGYVSDFKLPLCFGEPTPNAVETVNAHVRRIAFMYDAVRPGKTKREVFEACRREFKAEKSDAPLWLVHGVGMDVHEEPRMSSAYPTGHERVAPEIVFEEGNVLSLEGSWLVEELAVLERDGPKRIGSAGTRDINMI